MFLSRIYLSQNISTVSFSLALSVDTASLCSVLFPWIVFVSLLKMISVCPREFVQVLSSMDMNDMTKHAQDPFYMIL